MIYLIPDDFAASIKEDQLLIVMQKNPALLDQVELEAMSEAESYLRDRFDMATVWAKSGSDRFPILVRYLVDMALYHLHSNIAGKNIPQIRMDRYDMAIRWLTKVNKGQLSPALPEKEGGADELRWGSNDPLRHSY